MTRYLTGQAKFQVKDFDEVVASSPYSYDQIIERHQYRLLWTYAANCILGLWLLTSPLLLQYRSIQLSVSDIASGIAVIAIEFLAFSPKRCLVRCLTPLVALWLLFSPLVFWAPQPAVYLNDTLIACLLIAFSFLVPGAPGQGGVEKPGPDKPPGWTYNPSSWIRRWAGIVLALLGFMISRYLAARQLGYIPHALDPFFGNGSERVLHSVISRSFPISDAGFGSVAYMLEVLAGFMGDRARWRTAPWVVITFALLVVPLGVTSIVLVISQPIVVGSWCGLCLIAAVGLLLSVPLAVHEIIAMGQFLVAAKAQGKNVWKVFWTGGSIIGSDGADPDRRWFSLGQRWVSSVQGITVPLSIIAQLVIGIWLMACPDLLSLSKGMADCNHLLGALVVTVAAIATAEVTRTARLINIPLGVLTVAAAFICFRGVPVLLWVEVFCGLALIWAALPRGDIIERYAGWNKYIK